MYPVSANPLHWADLLIGLSDIGALQLDKVVYMLCLLPYSSHVPNRASGLYTGNVHWNDEWQHVQRKCLNMAPVRVCKRWPAYCTVNLRFVQTDKHIISS